MTCQCGFENAHGAHFCASCGAVLGGAVTPVPSGSAAQPARPAAASSAGPRPSGMLISILAILLVAGGFLGYWAYDHRTGDYKPDDSGLRPVVSNGKWGYIDKTGAVVIQPAYDLALGFQEGLAPVIKDHKFGFIDTKGQMVIAPQFDQARNFYHGYAAVKSCCGFGTNPNDQWGFIGKGGNYVINPRFQTAFDFREGDVAPVKLEGKWGLVNTGGKMVLQPTYDFIVDFSEGLAGTDQGGHWGFLNKSGEFAIQPQFEGAIAFHDGLAQVRSGGKVGFIDRSGKFIINPQFDRAGIFQDGVAIVRVGSQSGIIDKSGKYVLDLGKVNLLNDFFSSDDVAAARNDDGVGFIDRSGNWVVKPARALQNAGVMRGGIGDVKIAGGESTYIDKNGVVLWGTYKGQSVSSITKSASSESAAAAVRTINTAQVTYFTVYPQAGYADALAKLGPPPSGVSPDVNHAGLISASLAGGEDNGYKFVLTTTTTGAVVTGYKLVASPTSGQERSFCANQTAVVRAAKPGETCDPDNSPPM